MAEYVIIPADTAMKVPKKMEGTSRAEMAPPLMDFIEDVIGALALGSQQPVEGDDGKAR